MEIVRLVDSRLSVHIQVAPPFFVSELAGEADRSGEETLREWTARLVEEPAAVVVLGMGGLAELSSEAASTLTRGLREAQRLEKDVRLVRCRRNDFDRLRAAGLRGDVWHCGSLAQATEGVVGCSERSTRLHFMGDPAALRRVDVMMAGLAGSLRLPPERVEGLRIAVQAAVANAIQRGCPRGAHDRISMYIHRFPGELVVEVQDRSTGLPVHAEPTSLHPTQPFIDEVEFLPNPEGLLTRLVMWLPTQWEPA